MTLTATPPVVAPYFSNTSAQYHDYYFDYTKGGTIPGSVPNDGNQSFYQIPITLRDDPWNTYTYNPATGKALFHWYAGSMSTLTSPFPQ